jgi:hypothetical protein
MQEAAVLPHPLENASNRTSDGSFDVWIEARQRGQRAYTKRPFKFQGNDCYLALSEGEEYQIRYKSSYPEDVFVRILVDGLNTLSQQQITVAKGAYVEAADPKSDGEYVVAPRVSLEEARPWAIDKTNRGAVLTAMGFYDVNGKTDTVRRFQIVDADESAAARKNYTEQIGLITVAFYKAVEPPPSRGIRIGTGMGNVEGTRVGRYTDGKVPGEMIAVYNIRYMTPEMLKQIVK